MALFKLGKYWSYDFWVDGIRYRKSAKLTDKREAQKVEGAVRTDLARRRFTRPSKSLRFSELCERYAEFAKTNGKPAYIREKYHIATHLVPHFGEILVHAINLDVCERYKKNRLKTGAEKSTINREISTLKAILKYAGERDLAPEGVGGDVCTFTNMERKETRIMTRDDIKRLLKLCASPDFQAREPYLFPVVTVMANTGLRPRECIRLAKGDLDLEHRVISVRQTKTKSGIRNIPISSEVAGVLSRWLPHVKGEWVFPSPKKPGAHIRDFAKAFAEAVKEAGLKGFTPRSLRRMFATKLSKKARRTLVAKLKGHSR